MQSHIAEQSNEKKKRFRIPSIPLFNGRRSSSEARRYTFSTYRPENEVIPYQHRRPEERHGLLDDNHDIFANRAASPGPPLPEAELPIRSASFEDLHRPAPLTPRSRTSNFFHRRSASFAIRPSERDIDFGLSLPPRPSAPVPGQQRPPIVVPAFSHRVTRRTPVWNATARGLTNEERLEQIGETSQQDLTTFAGAAGLEARIKRMQSEASANLKKIESENTSPGSKLVSKLKKAITPTRDDIKYKVPQDKSTYSRLDPFEPPEVMSIKQTVERRISESHNLARKKVQELTGDGKVPRKQVRSDAPTPFSTNKTFGRPSEYFPETLEEAEEERQLMREIANMEADKSLLNAEEDDESITIPPKPSANTSRRLTSSTSGLAHHNDVRKFSAGPIAPAARKGVRFAEPEVTTGQRIEEHRGWSGFGSSRRRDTNVPPTSPPTARQGLGDCQGTVSERAPVDTEREERERRLLRRRIENQASLGAVVGMGMHIPARLATDETTPGWYRGVQFASSGPYNDDEISVNAFRLHVRRPVGFVRPPTDPGPGELLPATTFEGFPPRAPTNAPAGILKNRDPNLGVNRANPAGKAPGEEEEKEEGKEEGGKKDEGEKGEGEKEEEEDEPSPRRSRLSIEDFDELHMDHPSNGHHRRVPDGLADLETDEEGE